MLIAALIATYFLMGGRNIELLPLPADVDKRFEMVITDTNQKKEIKKIIDEAHEDLLNINERIKTIVLKGRELNIDYSSTEEDFKPLIAGLLDERNFVQKQILDLHFQLREKIDEQQWSDIFKEKDEN